MQISPLSYVQRREAELKAEMVYLGFVRLWESVANAMTVKREMDFWTEEFTKLRAKYVRRGRKVGSKNSPKGQKDTSNEQQE